MKRKESNFNGLLKTEGHKLSKTDEIQHPQFPPSGLCISGTRVIISFLISPSCNTFEQVKHTRNVCSTKKTDCTLKTTGRVTNAELSCTRGQPDVYGPAEDWNSHFPLDTRTSLFPVLHTMEASLCWGIQNYQGSGLAEKLRSMKNPTPFLLILFHSDACTDQRAQKPQQFAMRIIWCYKTLPFLLHYQTSNKTFHISFPCP